MLKAIRVGWHKARALSVLQTFYELPFKEPLAESIRDRLIQLSRENMEKGGTPHDTATFYYVEMAERAIKDNQTLNELNFGTVLGRISRSNLKFYDKHVQGLKRIKALEEARGLD